MVKFDIMFFVTWKLIDFSSNNYLAVFSMTDYGPEIIVIITFNFSLNFEFPTMNILEFGWLIIDEFWVVKLVISVWFNLI